MTYKNNTHGYLTRRQVIINSLVTTALGGLVAHSFSNLGYAARKSLKLDWDDLIPPGVPYGEIIADGEMDEENDTWNPVYDANASKLNENLNGAYVRLPGFIIPLDVTGNGVTSFMLVPYVGACLHVPPPPPNQLVFVKTANPWPNDQLWDPVWVLGEMKTKLQDTDLGQVGYLIHADNIEIYDLDAEATEDPPAEG